MWNKGILFTFLLQRAKGHCYQSKDWVQVSIGPTDMGYDTTFAAY